MKSHWEQIKLADLFELQMGKTPAREKDQYWKNGDNKWVSIADIGKFLRYTDETKEKITDIAISESGIKQVPKNTLIMSFKLSLGKVAITSETIYTNEAIMAFIDRKKRPLSLSFLFHLFKNKDWSAGTNKAVLGMTLNKATLKEISIPVPPLLEQEEIAQKLDAVCRLITLRKQQLQKLDQLASSRFIEMFGDPIKNPKAWITLPLGDLTEIVRGGSPRPIDKFLGGTIPWIKIGDATLGDDIYLHSTKDHIIEQGLSKTRYIKAGSLIFANCGVSLGFARIINFDGCIHDGWLALGNISERLNKIFLLKTLNHCTDFFRCTAPDGTQPNLNTGIMKKFVQIVPPLELQNEFAVFIEQLDKSKLADQTYGVAA